MGGCRQVLNLRLDQRNFGLAPFVRPSCHGLARVPCTMPIEYHDKIGERQKNITFIIDKHLERHFVRPTITC